MNERGDLRGGVVWLRGLFVFMVVLQGCLQAEVRSYQLSEQVLRKAYWEWTVDSFGARDPFDAEEEGDVQDLEEWPMVVVDEAGFKSRFLVGGEELRDFTKNLNEMLGPEEGAAQAVYDVKGEKLIVEAGVEGHEILREAVESMTLGQLMTEVAIYEVPGVGLERRSAIWEDVAEGAELLAGVSCVGLVGSTMQARTSGGGLVLELESQMDSDEGLVDNRFTLVADLPEVKFSLMTGFVIPLGTRWVQEIGALDGGRMIVMVIKQDRMTATGGLWDEWILKERGGVFLRGERLEKMRRKDREDEPGFDLSRAFQVFDLSVTMDVFSGYREPGFRSVEAGEYPELGGMRGKFFSLEKLLKENGVSFREGDFVVLKDGSSRVYAKLSEESLKLLQLIIESAKPGPPRMIRVDFAEMEGGGFEKGRILKKVGVSVLPGQSGEVEFGGDLSLQVEAQIDVDDEEVEMRLTLAENGGGFETPSIRTGFKLLSGKPVVIQESVVGEVRKMWVVTARVVALDEEVDLFLKHQGRVKR